MAEVKKIIGIFSVVVFLAACSNSNKADKPVDFLNDFIESEISYLENNSVTLIKFVNIDGKVEEIEYVPDWKKELSFLNDYINDFRKNGELPLPNSKIKEDTLTLVFNKSTKKKLLVFYFDDELIGFSIQENQSSRLNSRSFLLKYEKKNGYKLKDKSKTLWVIENNIEIKADYIAP